MATVAPSDQASDLLQKLALESEAKGLEVGEATKKASVESGNGQIPAAESHVVAELVDPTMCYVPTAYYYGGYDGSGNEWEDLSRYVSPEGVDLSNGVMYHGYGYGAYGGSDGQVYGAQQYQYPVGPYFQQKAADKTSAPVKSSFNPPLFSSNRPNSHFMGFNHPRPLSHGFMNRMYPNKLYGPPFRYDSRRSWLPVDPKFKPRGRPAGYYAYANENMDGLNELNRGPRAKGSKNLKDFSDKSSLVPDKDLFNKPDFPEEYADAKFFIIKSYSEDDVHKSIKYNVWASTPNGNKKLHAAFQDKSAACPVFLLFSVNTSGQFVGLAEMVGPVDFNKSVEYWQQDKWNGCFPVKWHIVKDVPNSLLKHITLDNNENKPVTNSRDTQEVKLEPGLKLIKIFKEHSSKTCILDDFGFYETRQQTIQEKKAKQQQFQKQVWEGKPVDEKKEVAQEALGGGENGNVVVGAAGDAPKGAKPAVVANGVANGC